MASVRFGALDPRHRGRLAEILAATAVFSPDEIGVALGLFDETFEVPGCASSTPHGPPSGLARTSNLEPPTSGYEFIGAYDDAGMLTGYACYGPTPGTDRTYDLYWIAVHPGAQGHGAGSRLLEEVERRLRARGGRLLIVETSSRGAYAGTRRFYESRGYREAARVESFYAPSDDRIVYTKRLTPAAARAAAVHSPPPH